jgi:hypothetical protein
VLLGSAVPTITALSCDLTAMAATKFRGRGDGGLKRGTKKNQWNRKSEWMDRHKDCGGLIFVCLIGGFSKGGPFVRGKNIGDLRSCLIF